MKHISGVDTRALMGRQAIAEPTREDIAHAFHVIKTIVSNANDAQEGGVSLRPFVGPHGEKIKDITETESFAGLFHEEHWEILLEHEESTPHRRTTRQSQVSAVPMRSNEVEAEPEDALQRRTLHPKGSSVTARRQTIRTSKSTRQCQVALRCQTMRGSNPTARCQCTTLTSKAAHQAAPDTATSCPPWDIVATS